ncbi:hypothetical protein ANN_15606 [Periplaneta americana]|uniref:Transposase Tc1-like domain-containing protein n=1 Tax=Periplaneta americana TaxID=6978 RepID=A0ABQ8SGX4_PERAM|nr:hypothetical protein ANN_15606 [Periplaneta americana]
MSPGSSTESYPAFARIGLRENPGKNLNQVTCPYQDSNLGHLLSRPDALAVTPQLCTEMENALRRLCLPLVGNHCDYTNYEECVPHKSDTFYSFVRSHSQYYNITSIAVVGWSVAQAIRACVLVSEKIQKRRRNRVHTKKGQPKKLSEREERFILKKIKENPRLSATKLAACVREEFSKQVGAETIRKVLGKEEFNGRKVTKRARERQTEADENVNKRTTRRRQGEQRDNIENKETTMRTRGPQRDGKKSKGTTRKRRRRHREQPDDNENKGSTTRRQGEQGDNKEKKGTT